MPQPQVAVESPRGRYIAAMRGRLIDCSNSDANAVFLIRITHRYLFFDLVFLCLFNFRIIITATPHNKNAKSLCCKNHTIPPAIAKIIPKIPIDCIFLTNVITQDS
jgi:hypothetical protein